MRRRWGETLSPGVMPLLAYLGLDASFRRLGHLPCGGTASAWGSGQVLERSYLFSGRGQGWHLDRARFDAWMLECARDAGVDCIRARVTGARRDGAAWRLDLAGRGSIVADAVIDASGRGAWLSRHVAAPPARDDGLVAEVRWFRQHEAAPDVDGALVESALDGWWYSASLPGRRGVAAFMTDHDLRARATWASRLAGSGATGRRLAAWRQDGDVRTRAAHSQCARALAGDGWVAAGDAAVAFDPLSSMGIGFALRSGMEAVRVAVGMIEGEAGPARDYAASARQTYADYRVRLASVYAVERRWPHAPFWARRNDG